MEINEDAKLYIDINLFSIHLYSKCPICVKENLDLRWRRKQTCHRGGMRISRERFGVPVDVIFGGSGFVLSQMKLQKREISTFQDLPTSWRWPKERA